MPVGRILTRQLAEFRHDCWPNFDTTVGRVSLGSLAELTFIWSVMLPSGGAGQASCRSSYAINLNTAQRYEQNLSWEIRGSLMAYLSCSVCRDGIKTTCGSTHSEQWPYQ